MKTENTNKKELIVVISNLFLGGTERHIATISKYLVERNWSVKVFLLNKPGVLNAFLEEAGVLVFPLYTEKQLEKISKLPFFLKTFLRVVLSVYKIAKMLKSSPNAIIHFFLPESYILGMWGAFLARHRGPTVMSRRSMNHYYQRRIGIRWCEKYLFGRTTMISGNSKAVIDQLYNEGIPKNKLRLIYNGIDETPFITAKSRQETRKKLNIAEDALVMIIVANVIPYKGHADLLIALAEIKESLPIDWFCLCVGRDDGIGKDLEKKALELGISDHIHWLGSRVDVANLLMASDLGILCSHEEGFSNAILECMLAGLPMVVTDVGGNREAVLNEETGFVVPAHQPKVLAEAILALVMNRERAKEMGAKGKQRVKEKFSLEACVNAYEKLYDECAQLIETGTNT